MNVEKIVGMMNDKTVSEDVRNALYEMSVEISYLEKANADNARRKSMNKTAQSIHVNAVKHGWWKEKREFGTMVALMHSELSEALEHSRNGLPLVFEADGHKDGVAVELVDCVIRIFDYLAHEKIDIDAIMKDKMDYNETRPYMHGKRF